MRIPDHAEMPGTPGDCPCGPCAASRAGGGGARRCAVRGAIVAAVGAAVIAGSSPVSTATEPPDAPPSQTSQDESSPEALPEAEAGDGVDRGLEQAVGYALAHLGDPYALGGNGPHRWDCSGLIQQAYRRAGVTLPRIAADQYRATRRIKRGELRRGDLVFWSGNGRASGVHHVAIYLGDGRYLEAARPGTKVRISTFSDYSPNLYGRVSRPPEPARCPESCTEPDECDRGTGGDDC